MTFVFISRSRFEQIAHALVAWPQGDQLYWLGACGARGHGPPGQWFSPGGESAVALRNRPLTRTQDPCCFLLQRLWRRESGGQPEPWAMVNGSVAALWKSSAASSTSVTGSSSWSAGIQDKAKANAATKAKNPRLRRSPWAYYTTSRKVELGAMKFHNETSCELWARLIET